MIDTNTEGQAKILIVEDDSKQRVAILKLLSNLNAEIFEAGSGQEALSAMLRQDFMLVLLDINMPNMDGIETARIMRSNKQTESIPIIYMTGYSQDDKSVQEAYKLGAIDYLFKPLKEEILISKVEMFLRYHKLEQERLRQIEVEQAEIKLQSEVLAKQNKELQEFSYIASHDLQSPLTTIGNYVNILKEDYEGKLDADADKYLDVISNSVLRMKKLIKDLLDYSLLGNNREKSRIDCNEILANIQENLRHVIIETHSQITSEDLPHIQGYPTEIGLLFQNLLSNAIKFRKADIAPKIQISVIEEIQNDIPYWKFNIQDNGIGIPKKQQEKIFDIFQKLHSRKKYEGTGIGLAHCRKIVDLHEGKIWIESEDMQGCSFIFTLPK